MKFWLWQLLIAIDQALNALLGGWADETVSSRAWRLSDSSKGWSRTRRAIDALAGLFGDPQHCFESYTSERLRLQLPPEFRQGEEA